MPTSWLKLPLIPQSTDGYCLQACVRMILSAWQDDVSEAELSRLFGSTQYGTPSSRVTRLSQRGYTVEYRTATLQEINRWLAARIPIIAFVQTEFLEYWAHLENTRHAVVIVGIDNQNVYLNDPLFESAPQVASIDGFLAAWAEMDEVVAMIKR